MGHCVKMISRIPMVFRAFFVKFSAVGSPERHTQRKWRYSFK